MCRDRLRFSGLMQKQFFTQQHGLFLESRAQEEIDALQEAGVAVEVVPGITAALAGAASLHQSLTLRGISRSVAFVTLAQGKDNAVIGEPIATPVADTLVYYMGRKDAANIAKQLIDAKVNHTTETPVHILEAVSTTKERLWSSTLGKLADGLADDWFDASSPALILIGQAFSQIDAETTDSNQGTSAKINDGLQDSKILTNSRRRA